MSPTLQAGLAELGPLLGPGDVSESIERVDVDPSGALFFDVATPLGGRWYGYEGGAFVERVPHHDRRLKLSRRLDPATRTIDWDVLSYRPGKRLVVSETQGGHQLVTKGLRSGRLERTARTHRLGQRSARSAGFVPAQLLELDEEHASLCFERLETLPLTLTAADADDFFHIGRSLRTFQDSADAGELATHDALAELAVLDAWLEKVQRVGGVVPLTWHAGRAEAGLRQRELPGARHGLAHRDLHDGQLARTPGGMALFDFDLLCRADVALDAANLLAHLGLRELQGIRRADGPGTRACGTALMEGVGRQRSAEFRARLAFYEGTTYLRLALVYALRPKWSALGEELVRRGRHSLARVQQGGER